MLVFQAKFSRAPDNKTERQVILDLIASEATKLPKLIRRGATHYYFITNVQGTAHLDSGSIDQANATLLQPALGIPVHVWWRDDIDRRLDNAPDVKWSYAEILNSSALLPLLAQLFGNGHDLSSARTFKSYLADQYASNREVKFKQVDLTCTLTDLFVDLPLRTKRRQEDPDRRRPAPSGAPPELHTYLSELDLPDADDVDDDSHPSTHAGLAAAFFLQMPLVRGASKFVLEGAPGQGKSTVTQFICQVDRLRLLQKTIELSGVDHKHRRGPVRAPFRVDLRDYAAWLTGRHPFAAKGEATLPPEGRRSLESFIAMQVTWQSRTRPIDEDQLLEFFERFTSTIVLDGFDEVADIATRTRLVEEIRQAAERLGAHARSLQIIVTSRPAAFTSSPGFPENDWVHLELRNLHRRNIEAYKNKWIQARGLTPDEGTMVSSTLEDKLEQPHLRDLSRNPMQLAILLHLIHVQGAALPEKRTTLYEEYMKLFFNREAEKSTVVRDHRELRLSSNECG